MKSQATIIWVNDTALEFGNGGKCYECKFVDDDGIVGKVYPSKKPTKGTSVVVRLEQDGDKFKFKIDK